MQEDLENLDDEEISYPMKHLSSTITAEIPDEANHSMLLVSDYMRDLMKKAGYEPDTIHKLLFRILPATGPALPIRTYQKKGP